jgi:hypothetical protein
MGIHDVISPSCVHISVVSFFVFWISIASTFWIVFEADCCQLMIFGPFVRESIPAAKGIAKVQEIKQICELARAILGAMFFIR